MLQNMESKKSGSKNGTTLKKLQKKSEGNLTFEEGKISAFDENRIMRSAVPRLFKVSKTAPDINLLAAASVSFSMVRHPFERLVSAYQDKVMERPVGSIIKSLKNNYGKTTFESFAYLVIKSASKNECLKTYGNCKFNNHWKPYIS